MSLEEQLYRASPEEYGDHHAAHLFEQYKLYIEMADRISSRRQAANSFFLTINTVLLTFAGFFTQRNGTGNAPVAWVLIVALAGLLLCLSWYRLVRSYKDLNSGKFKVIHAIETRLPLAPYGAEWESVGRGVRRDLYLPFTHIELRIPSLFAALYVALAVYGSVQGVQP